jgi:hypothetical protein
VSTPASDSKPTTAAEIRLVNGARVIILAFVTILIAFVAVMICYVTMNANPPASGSGVDAALPFPKAEIIGILGAFTGVVGTLVGSYFSISSANGARESTNVQAQAANLVAQHLVGELSADQKKSLFQVTP